MKARADIKANINSRLPSRHAAATTRECAIKLDRFGVVEIFKKTPSIADSRPAGRDLAKDMLEAAGIPFPVMTQLAVGEPAERREIRKPLEAKCGSGAIRGNAQQVGPAVNGAITHRGGAKEKQRYADI
jgi:dihydroxyacid dehydratase/phosphogluconate dehydratase